MDRDAKRPSVGLHLGAVRWLARRYLEIARMRTPV